MKKSIFIIVIAASLASSSYCSAVCSPSGTGQAASHGMQSGSAGIIVLGLAAIELGSCTAQQPVSDTAEAAAAPQGAGNPCRENSNHTVASLPAKSVADAAPALVADKPLCDISGLSRKTSGYKMAADSASLAK